MLLRLMEERWPLDEVVFYDTGMEFKAIYDIRDRIAPMLEQNGIVYPELPIVPMVDGEIVAGDEWGRWLGSWGSSCIGEYIIGEEQLHFREENDFEEVEKTLTDGIVCYDIFEEMTEEEAEGAYASLAWIKAIIVNIDMPDN